jgi:hypothetical protein
MSLLHLIRAALIVMSSAAALGGCASVISSAASNFADNLSTAVLNQTDPETVQDGAPAYLLLVDSLLEGNPNNPALLAVAAQLYASYGAVFAYDPLRAKRLTERARTYAFKGMCEAYKAACNWKGLPFEEYEISLGGLRAKHAKSVYAYGVSSLAYVRTHSDDWNALAELPHIEALLNRYLQIGDPESPGSVYTYLGILATLRPPALGGEPEKGREYFEQAIEVTDGVDLAAKVEFARGYARLMYDRELHDELLADVLQADPVVPGFTLTNVLAQRDATLLLASADDYF